MSSIPAQPHTFMEIDHEIFSLVLLLLPLIKLGILSITSASMSIDDWFFAESKLVQESMVRLPDYLTITITVDRGV